MKARLVELQCHHAQEDGSQTYTAIEFTDIDSGYRRIWRMPMGAYNNNPERSKDEAQAIVAGINGGL